jgi:hypothetical protein
VKQYAENKRDKYPIEFQAFVSGMESLLTIDEIKAVIK